MVSLKSSKVAKNRASQGVIIKGEWQRVGVIINKASAYNISKDKETSLQMQAVLITMQCY